MRRDWFAELDSIMAAGSVLPPVGGDARAHEGPDASPTPGAVRVLAARDSGSAASRVAEAIMVLAQDKSRQTEWALGSLSASQRLNEEAIDRVAKATGWAWRSWSLAVCLAAGLGGLGWWSGGAISDRQQLAAAERARAGALAELASGLEHRLGEASSGAAAQSARAGEAESRLHAASASLAELQARLAESRTTLAEAQSRLADAQGRLSEQSSFAARLQRERESIFQELLSAWRSLGTAAAMAPWAQAAIPRSGVPSLYPIETPLLTGTNLSVSVEKDTRAAAPIE